MLAQTREHARRMFAAKIDGTLVLDALFAEVGVDFLVLFSSIDALVGFAGDTDYGAANRFLDHYAAARSSTRLPVLSINWDAWLERGMAHDSWAGDSEVAARFGIRPEEGRDALRRVLDVAVPQVAVITRDFSAVRAQAHGVRPPDAEAAAAAGTAAGADTGLTQHARPALAQAYVEAESEQERFIAGVWQELLGLDRVGIDDNFFELGGHSLIATGMLTRVQQEFGVKLPLRVIFEASTVRTLAERVDVLRWVTQGAAAATGGAVEDEAGTRDEFEI